MISALQGSRVEGLTHVARSQSGTQRPPEQRDDSRQGSGTSGFREARGPTVTGGTLIAAQIAASADSQDTARTGSDPKQSTATGTELTQQEREQVKDMQARDREVRTHEQAHATAGGQHAGAPEYEIERGPDGRSYAVAGHVSISTSPVAGDPEATVAKMETVKRAALAPAEPSGADRSVAADAEGKRADARSELASIRAEERKAALEDSSGDDGETDPAIGPDRKGSGSPRPPEPFTAPAPGLPGRDAPEIRTAGTRSGEDEAADADDTNRAGQRQDERMSRDFAAFLNQSGADRARADLQPGLAAGRQGVDIRL